MAKTLKSSTACLAGIVGLTLVVIAIWRTAPSVDVSTNAAEDDSRTPLTKFRSASHYTSKIQPSYLGIKVQTYLDRSEFKRFNTTGVTEVDVKLDEAIKSNFEVFDAQLRRVDSERPVEQQPYYASDKPDDVDARFLLLQVAPDNYFLDFILRARTEDVSDDQLKSALVWFESRKIGLSVFPVANP